MKIIILFIVLITSCVSKPNQKIDDSYSYPRIFESAFENTKVNQENIEYSFYTLDIGKIKIESGKIIVCDPIVMNEGVAFADKFPVGEFNVQLAMAKMGNDKRVAFSRIVFSNNKIENWEIALLPNQKKIPINNPEIYCFGVDSGTGVFIDDSTNNFYNKKYNAESDWEEVFVKKAEENNYTGYTHEFENHNFAVFSTGYGDGCYTTFIGYDESGNICKLLVDFGIINWLDEKN